VFTFGDCEFKERGGGVESGIIIREVPLIDKDIACDDDEVIRGL
jgi:hypothetical protein